MSVTAYTKAKVDTLLTGYVAKVPAASGNATTDTANIAAAVAAAPAGSTIEFDPAGGAYQINGNLHPGSGITTAGLHLNLRGATLKVVTSGLHEWLVFTTGADNSMVANGIVDGNNLTRTVMKFTGVDGPSVVSVKFKNYTANTVADTGIKFVTTTNPSAIRCDFTDWGYVGSTSSNLTRCIALGDKDTFGGHIALCKFKNVCRAVDVVGARHIVRDNIIDTTYDNGFYLTTSNVVGVPLHDITVKNNVLVNVEEGIVVAGANEGTTDYAERIQIVGNVIWGWTIDGIVWDHRVRDLSITDNTLINDSDTNLSAPRYIGLRSSNQVDAALSVNVKIEGNKLRGTISYAAIWVQNMQGTCSISHNDFDIAPTDGSGNPVNNLRLIKVQGPTCDGLTVQSNTLKVNNGATGTLGMWVTGRVGNATSTNCNIGMNNHINTTSFADTAGWTRPYTPAGVTPQSLLNGGGREPFPRASAGTALSALTSGVETTVAVPVFAGDVISAVAFLASSVGLTMGTNNDGHLWFALRDSAGNLLAQSADQGGSVTWAANTGKKLTLASSYTVPANGYVYATIMVNVGTGGSPAVPSLRGLNPATTSITNISGIGTVAVLSGTAGSGLTATAPSTATLAAAATVPWCLAA